jgi:hypothetical protein
LASSLSTKFPEIDAVPLAAVNLQEPAITGSGFAPNGVIPGLSTIVRGAELYGSYVAEVTTTRTVRTRWYRPVPSFYLLLAGFPDHRRGYIYLELNTPDGIHRQELNLDEAPEYWRLQKITLPGARRLLAFRIVATEIATGSMGWIGFSLPFKIGTENTLEVLKQLLLVALCTAASFVAFIGPGLLFRARFTRRVSAGWLVLPGIFFMSCLGLLAWKGPAAISPLIVSRAGLSLLALVLGFELARRPLTSLITSTELRVLGLLSVLVLLAVAKGTYSIGPSGELYRGTISRTLEVGARADSRIPFVMVQLVGLRKTAYSEVAHALFAPWNFSDRGPLAGIAVSPIVLASGPQLSGSIPSHPWTPFDPDGFAAYRIAMIVLSAASLLIVFALAKLFLSDKWALFTFFVAAAAPFTIHELFFTWPKILAACFVLLGVYSLASHRYFLAGCAVGLGYLCHPSALLWFPWILLTIPLLHAMPNISWRARLVQWSRSIAATCAGLAVWLLLWRYVNRGHFEQAGFFAYFREAGGLPLTAGNWLWFRTLSALKTLVPFYIFAFHRTDPDLISIDGTTQPWVQFVQQYWCSLAFAGGVLFYFVLVRLTVTACRRATAWIAMIFLPALALFIAYFGAPNSGLMREGLHAWFLGFIVFALVIWHKYFTVAPMLWKFAIAALAFRGLETVWVLIPFASWSRGYIMQPPFAVSDGCCLLLMLAGSAYLAIYATAQCKSLQPIHSYTANYGTEVTLPTRNSA